MKMAISIILLLISFLIYIVCIFEIDITSFIKNKKRRKKVKREKDQTIQELEEAQQAFNKFKERKHIMSKLEEKLLELGYGGIFVGNDNNIYYKKQIKRIVLDFKCEKIITSYLRLSSLEIDSEKQIRNIQKHFKKLQKDLKELQECQNVEAANI